MKILNWLKKWWSRDKLHPIEKEDMITFIDKKGKHVSIPKPNQKQELVFTNNGDILIRNVKSKRVKKKDFGL